MATPAWTGLRDDPTHIAQLRSALWSAGYNAAKVADMLGADRQHLQPDAAQSILLQRQLPAGQALSTQIRLFILALPVTRGDAAAALARLSLDSAVELGVVSPSEEMIVGALRITPYGDFLVASSRVPDLDAVERDHVMGVTRSTLARKARPSVRCSTARSTVYEPLVQTSAWSSRCDLTSASFSSSSARLPFMPTKRS